MVRTTLHCENLRYGAKGFSEHLQGSREGGIMCADIEAIQFNHDPDSLAADAMNIRKNALYEVELPEWVKGDTNPEDSPAAYCIKETNKNTITIKARFSALHNVDTLYVKAEGGGVLGPVKEKCITITNGISTPDTQFELEKNRIKKRGINREDIAWRWMYKYPEDTRWHDMATTRHRIYTVLEEPHTPWTQQRGSNANPWTDVLDEACVIASGRTTKRNAARAIVQHIYHNYRLSYDTVRGKSSYSTSYGKFNLTAWLNSFAYGHIVNCYDCTAALAALGNVVGCDLVYYFHFPFGYVNTIVLIGESRCNNPFYENPQFSAEPVMDKDDTSRSAFSNHTYTKMDEKVFDAAMRGETTVQKIPKTMNRFLEFLTDFVTNPFWFADITQEVYEDNVIDTSTREERRADRGTSRPLDISVY